MVNVPDIEPGHYTMQIALDTRSRLGLLVSKREVTILDPKYNVLCSNYHTYLNEGDTEEAKKTRDELLSTWFEDSFAPGQDRFISRADQIIDGEFPGMWNFCAVLRFYPEKDCLRVTAVVTDAYLTEDLPYDMPWNASCLEILTAPAGTDETLNQYFLIPRGEPDSPRVVDVHSHKESLIEASWRQTSRGYVAEMRIPWSIMRGYEDDWTVMPMEAMIDTRSPKGRVQMCVDKPGRHWLTARGYAVLAREE